MLKDYRRQVNEALTKEHIEQLLYMYDLHDLYKNPNARCQEILEQILSTSQIVESNNIKQAVLDKINVVFFQKYSNDEYTNVFGEYALGRLRHDQTRKYYSHFIELQKLSLKDRIENELTYFYTRQRNDPILFIGDELGEIPRSFLEYPYSSRKLFIDLQTKTNKQLVNIAISKINIEDEYVSFQLHKFFGFLYDVGLLSKDVYNQLIYGSNNEAFITLVKQGLPMNLVNLLNENTILEHIEIGDYDIKGNQKYTNFYNEQTSDFLKFILDQYIDKE